MSSKARYVSGETSPRPVLCDPNYPIEVGDLLFQVPAAETSSGSGIGSGANLARPASAMFTQTTLALAQGAFHDLFLGVAMQKNGAQANETLPLHSTVNHQPPNVITVATSGRFRFPLAASSGPFYGGEYIGPTNMLAEVGTTSGTSGVATGKLENQVVAKVATGDLSIGRATPGAGEVGNQQGISQGLEGQPVSLVDEVIVEIRSTVFSGGYAATVSGTSSGQE